jgi:hypothetical protein
MRVSEDFLSLLGVKYNPDDFNKAVASIATYINDSNNEGLINEHSKDKEQPYILQAMELGERFCYRESFFEEDYEDHLEDQINILQSILEITSKKL